MYRIKTAKPLLIILALLVFFTLAGCGSSSSSQAPASGRVGQPAEESVILDSQQTSEIPAAAPTASGQPQNLIAHFIDVGQGDSILVQIPGGFNLLIDGGPRTAGQKVVSYLKQAGITSIDLLISTHPHEDHIGGLIDILKSFEVKEVIDPAVAHTSKVFEDYLNLIDTKDIKFTEGRPGIERTLGPDVTLTILHPASPSSKSLNDASVVTKLSYNQVSFLFAGDAEKVSEDEIIKQSGKDLESTILKVGHHGSTTSTSPAFLKAINPQAAIIMCGTDNSYGHPHKETLDKLSAAGVNIYRTDLQGDIVITTDGKTYKINTTKETPKETKTEPAPIVTQSAAAEPATAAAPASGKVYVGSIKSDKYHYPNCRSAKNILPANEIWFANAKEAKNAGYSPCGTCKPPQS